MVFFFPVFVDLKLLILRSNPFRGVVIEFEFQKLHNIYLSRNTLSTQLPSHSFLDWIEMKTSALLKASSSAEV
ncbi:hypothetical protein NC653_002990 [Populus alba x Populus x berolinensis]|uniref:Uncharacterized protein n=1 Tax=Populus alba x Populus x berolinensis TaxID=444605 RepID=A0AAD6RR05_9ROSI|nr:hypothetical protein NC653_002990 [Populus alba x Populus x berolinensis]